MDEDQLPSVNFIPCVKWVRRGVANSHPVKVELTKQELEDVIRQTRASLRVNDDEGDSGTENDEVSAETANPEDEFHMDTYDDEGDGAVLNVAHVAEVGAEDGYNPAEEGDEPDSEDDDDIIKPTDNLICVGHVEGDASILEVYVYNEDEGSLYIHHDVLLPYIPLAMEWLNYDPDNVHAAGNLCAVGCMDPIIQVWDLDLVNTIDPAYKLGRKRSRKKGLSAVGHIDAVLCLAWNTNLTHILASGSVDHRVLLWDLEAKVPHTELDKFEEKIQSLKWHPSEPHGLLTGCADKTCKVWDCRSNDSFKSWTLKGEVENVSWNYEDSNLFYASDDIGHLYCFDSRADDPLWSVKAYDSCISGMHVSPVYPGLLVTVSQAGLLKIWDATTESPSLVAEKALKIGEAHCLDVASESPFTIAAGGDNRSHNFIVQSVVDIEAVKNRFQSKNAMVPPVIEGVPVAGPSSVKVREKRPRSAERALNVKKKSKQFVKTRKPSQ